MPDDIAALLASKGETLGACDVTVYLVDREQYVLVPLPQHADARAEPPSIRQHAAGVPLTVSARQLGHSPAWLLLRARRDGYSTE